MSARLAACDPCRYAKLACDHGRPVCSRCRNRNKAADCAYRAKPFKRKRHRDNAEDTISPEPLEEIRSARTKGTPVSRPASYSVPTTSQSYRYPNPGFLGSSSHEAIFNQFPLSGRNEQSQSGSANLQNQGLGPLQEDDTLALRGTKILECINDTAHVSHLKDLLFLWTSKGTSLALAEPFLEACIQAVHDIFSSACGEDHWLLSMSRKLLHNSSTPFCLNESSVYSDFVGQFSGSAVRWETLGLVLAAVVHATIVTPYYAPLYETEDERRHLMRLMTNLSDECLNISLVLDCLNDLQLIFHYENCILHSFVDGDQSFHTWRKLGDIASALFALGYHERIETGPRTPPFLAELRRNAFARIYSADKNMSLFLGRPCRINGRFCHFQIPTNHPVGQVSDLDAAAVDEGSVWAPGEKISFVADSKWTAVCAVLKEEILELFREQDPEKQSRKAVEVQQRAEKNWNYLPAHFRLERSMKNQRSTPFERDFLLHTRLNHLQILYLLRLILLRRLSEPDAPLLIVSQEILSLVVEATVLREQLVNAGTSLVWKVAYYGLPAVGIISLALLNNTVPRDHNELSRSQMLRDLTVLVAEIQTGGLVQLGDPNYALLSSATTTVQNVLSVVDEQCRKELDTPAPVVGAAGDEGWDPWINGGVWEFEFDFWRNLAEHPSLVGLENPVAL